MTGIKSKMAISMTRLPSLSQELKMDFSSKKELTQSILATLYVPILFESPIIIQDQAYGEGHLSCRQPLLDALTITVSPIPDIANIAPAQSLQVPAVSYSSYRKDIIDELHHRGYKDTKEWLSTMVLSGCLTTLIFRKSVH